MLAPMDPNAIAVERAGDVAVVTLSGEHDIYTAPTLRERIYAEVEDGRPVMIDLTATTFIDSSVLGVLIGARRRATEGDLGFAVCCGGELESGVRRVLEVTGLMSVLPVIEERDSALETVRAGPTPEPA